MSSIHYSCPILMKLEFSGQFYQKYSNMSKFMKIRQVEADRRTDGRTDMKLTVAVRNFAKSP
jgi:hypothetical protein